MSMTNPEPAEKTPFVPCDYGVDAMCTEDFGQPSCCMYFKVVKENTDQTIEH